MLKAVHTSLSLILALLLVSCTTPSVTQDDTKAIHTLLNNIEKEVNSGNFEAFTAYFTEDAIIMGDSSPDVIGIENIRKLYFEAMQSSDLFIDFTTQDIEVFKNIAYEQGTYLLRITDKKDGTLLAESESRYLHIFKKQNNGQWRTWRMFVNNFQ